MEKEIVSWKKIKNIVRSHQDKSIKKWRKLESNSFKCDSEKFNNVGNCFKFVNFTDRVKSESELETNGSQLQADVEEKLMSSSNMTCIIYNNQLEISNIGKVVNNGTQKCKLFDPEAVVETNLEHSFEKSYILTKSKDTNRNNEETNVETQTIAANMTVCNSKNNIDVSNNIEYVLPNVSYANILKQPSGIRRSSNKPAYVLSHISC